MSYVKEPEGVDFVINGNPLTEEQKQAVSAFIKADKAERTLQASHHKARSGPKQRKKHPTI